MKKFILFLALFLIAAAPGGTGSQMIDYFYIHPDNTNQTGLFELAEKIEKRNIFLNIEDVMCMAKNIFFEAAVESTAGKIAVAQVTLNRVRSPKYPNTICGVVYEGKHYASGFPKRNQCQFSWYCDGKLDVPQTTSSMWRASQEIAEYVLSTPDLKDITDGATHYHADYISSPRWASPRRRTVEIDTHIFYNNTRRAVKKI